MHRSYPAAVFFTGLTYHSQVACTLPVEFHQDTAHEVHVTHTIQLCNVTWVQWICIAEEKCSNLQRHWHAAWCSNVSCNYSFKFSSITIDVSLGHHAQMSYRFRLMVRTKMCCCNKTTARWCWRRRLKCLANRPLKHVAILFPVWFSS